MSQPFNLKPLLSAEERVSQLIPGYRQLVELGVRFYPVNADKSPAVRGRLSHAATTDPTTLRYWIDHRHHRGIAGRISLDARLLVLDTEHPMKHPDRVGPDGEHTLGALLLENDILLPACPLVRTPTGGHHRYFRVPRGYRICGAIAPWPGVDILAECSNVILAGSRTNDGNYVVVRGFDIPIPEVPRKLLRLIRRRQKRKGHQGTTPSHYGGNSSPEISGEWLDRRVWFRLWRNPIFRRLWRNEKQIGDLSASAYEFQLAKICACNGLGVEDTMTILVAWRCQRGLQTGAHYRKKLRRAIVPRAREAVKSWVEEWTEQRERDRNRLEAADTQRQILELISMRGPQTPRAAHHILAIPRERAKKAMQRLFHAGRLHRTPTGYALEPTATTGSHSGRPPSPATVMVLRLWQADPALRPAQIAALTATTEKAVKMILKRYATRHSDDSKFKT